MVEVYFAYDSYYEGVREVRWIRGEGAHRHHIVQGGTGERQHIMTLGSHPRFMNSGLGNFNRQKIQKIDGMTSRN